MTTDSEEILSNFENATTFERHVEGERAPASDVIIREPGVNSGDIELTEGDLGLGDRTFNPRS